jgi:hypothetical protein
MNFWCRSPIGTARARGRGYRAGSTPNRAGGTTFSDEVDHRRPWRVAVSALVLAGVASACAGGDSGGGATTGGEAAASAARPKVVAQPAATTPDAAFPVVESLVIEATGLADQLFEDPSVVEDGHAKLLDRFHDVYTADSPTPAGVEAQLRKLNAQGRRYRPGPSGRLRDVGVYRMTASGADQVSFRVCAIEDMEIVNAAGKVIGRRSQVTQGDGWAERTGGIWHFAGIDPDETATLPIAPGSAPSGFCDSLLGGPAQ